MNDIDCYWVEPRLLLAGEYPGDWDEDTARSKLDGLLEAGVRTFVDLTEPEELDPYDALLNEEAARRGVAVSYCRRPVRDLGVPGIADMRETLAVIAATIADGVPVYVHCRGGIGRTGTVVGCWLVERGLDGGAALDAIEALRRDVRSQFIPSPETGEQRRFVQRWAEAR